MIRRMNMDDLPKLIVTRADGNESAAQIEQRRLALEQLFPKLYFDKPWPDERIGSLVSENEQAEIEGTIGVFARPMNFKGRQITAAVCSDLFVKPAARHKMIGVQLLNEFLKGPQDVSVGDVANADSRRIWQQLGGAVAPLYGLNWMRVFRPTSFVCCALSLKRKLQLIGRAARPFSALLDGVSTRVIKRFRPPAIDTLIAAQLTPALFVENLARLLSADRLTPHYELPDAYWMWTRLDFINRDAGPSIQQMVRTQNGEIIGWYIYQLKPKGIARVAQLVATPKGIHDVLGHLLYDAWRRGAVGVMGRLQPQFLQTFLDHGCLLQRRSTFTLIHSRDPEIVSAFLDGRAFLSLLEGEACLDIWNDPEVALEALQHTTEQSTAKQYAARLIVAKASLQPHG